MLSMSKTVALFAGHGTQTDGSWDSGCTYKKYTEAALVARIANYAVHYLKKHASVKIITDAPKNEINMIKQVAKANAAKADIFISVHCDYEKAPSGTLPLYTSKKGKKLAAELNKAVMKSVGIKTRGLGFRTDLYELNSTNMPACIFECGSIKKDLKTMDKKANEYGKGLAKGIIKYLNLK